MRRYEPTFGSTSALLSTLSSVRFSSREIGFILKLPPTKNLRAMVIEMLWKTERMCTGRAKRRRNDDGSEVDRLHHGHRLVP